jgi:hypothetical protein
MIAILRSAVSEDRSRIIGSLLHQQVCQFGRGMVTPGWQIGSFILRP